MSDYTKLKSGNYVSWVYNGNNLVRSVVRSSGKEKAPEILDEVRGLERYRNWTDEEIFEELNKHIRLIFVTDPEHSEELKEYEDSLFKE